MNWIKQRYLDLAWWADSVPPLRWLKCAFGRHCPIDTFEPDNSGPNPDHVSFVAYGSHCAYCGVPTVEPEG